MTKRLEPEVYAGDYGEDPTVLYVPVARYPTERGALRAIHKSLWWTEAENDGWDYVRRGEQTVELHDHGPDEITYGPRDPETEDAKAICCRQNVTVHVFDVTG